jgi:hypothetical protein
MAIERDMMGQPTTEQRADLARRLDEIDDAPDEIRTRCRSPSSGTCCVSTRGWPGGWLNAGAQAAAARGG